MPARRPTKQLQQLAVTAFIRPSRACSDTPPRPSSWPHNDSSSPGWSAAIVFGFARGSRLRGGEFENDTATLRKTDSAVCAGLRSRGRENPSEARMALSCSSSGDKQLTRCESRAASRQRSERSDASECTVGFDAESVNGVAHERTVRVKNVEIATVPAQPFIERCAGARTDVGVRRYRRERAVVVDAERLDR
jgi:hypothetical protein